MRARSVRSLYFRVSRKRRELPFPPLLSSSLADRRRPPSPSAARRLLPRPPAARLDSTRGEPRNKNPIRDPPGSGARARENARTGKIRVFGSRPHQLCGSHGPGGVAGEEEKEGKGKGSKRWTFGEGPSTLQALARRKHKPTPPSLIRPIPYTSKTHTSTQNLPSPSTPCLSRTSEQSNQDATRFAAFFFPCSPSSLPPSP